MTAVAAVAVEVRSAATDAHVTDYAEALSALADSVALVSCEVDGRPWGMTVTAFCSISTDPPTVLVSLGTSTAAAVAIAESGRFGVSVLAEGQAAIARHGSRPGVEKYLEPFVGRHAPGGTPFIPGAVAQLDCEVVERIPVADHVLFLGRVRTARSSGGAPLLYHRRAYRRLGALIRRRRFGSR
jgi:flavin reductase (DIM6/NTAB) family NADH-FMN oxidoreductase RutF